MKCIWNNKLFPSLNLINGKTAPYVSKGIIRHHHYKSYLNLGRGVVDIRRITWRFLACKTQSSLPCDTKTKNAYNQPRYGRVYDLKYYLLIGYNNNWIITNFLDDGTDEVYYDHSYRTIIYGNVTNMSLKIFKDNFVAIDADDNSCHGYYIIIFSSSTYTLQEEFNIHVYIIYSGEMFCEGTHYFPKNINSHHYFC